MSQAKPSQRPLALAVNSLAGLLILTAALTADEPQPAEPQPAGNPAATEAPAADAPSAIQQALDKPISIDWQGTPLAEAVKQLEELGRIQIALDEQSLSEEGVHPAMPISMRLKDLPLRYVLNHTLRSLNLSYREIHGVLLVTSGRQPRKDLVVRVYDVHDLVQTVEGTVAGGLDYEALIDAITTIIDSDSWDNVRGTGSIYPGRELGTLTIAQTVENHQQISRLLAALRKARVQQAGKDYRAIAVEQPAPATFHVALEKALDQRVTLEVDKVPLDEAVAQIQADTGLNLVIDHASLPQTGFRILPPVSVRLTEVPLRAALAIMLAPHELTLTLRDGAVVITSLHSAEPRPAIVVYPVADLLHSPSHKGLKGGWYRTVEGTILETPGNEIEDILRTITFTIEPLSWDDHGGPGMIAPFAGNLVIRHTRERQEQIGQWFDDLRKILSDRERAGLAPPAPPMGPATLVFRQLDADPHVTYAEKRDNVLEAIKLVTATIAPGTWQGEADNYIVPVGTSIVVRHAPETLLETARLVSKLGFSGDGLLSPSACGFGAGSELNDKANDMTPPVDGSK